MRTDGRTDRKTGMTKLIVVFRNFENAPKKNNNKKRTLPKIQFSSSSFRYIHISSSTPYSQTQSAFFHVNDSSKFRSTAKAKTTASNICFFYGQAKQCELSFSKHSPN